MIDPTHWQKLADADPADVCRRSGASFVEGQGHYVLRVLADDLHIDPTARQVRWARPSAKPKPPGFHHWLLSVVYLLGAQDVQPCGEWVAHRGLPYGQFFFRGPHELPTSAIAEAFGSDGRRFLTAAERLGGRRSDFAECAAVLPVLPRVPLLYVLWEADDEFPARASILFDRTVSEHLLVDAVLSACEITTKALVGVVLS